MDKNLPKVLSYRSTLGQFMDFKDSLIWQDMKSEIQLWINNAHGALETDLDPISTAKVRGCIQAARDLLQLPDTIIGLMEQEQENADEN